MDSTGVKILDSADDIQERRHQVLDRYELLIETYAVDAGTWREKCMLITLWNLYRTIEVVIVAA